MKVLQEGFHIDNKVRCEGAHHPLCACALSLQVLTQLSYSIRPTSAPINGTASAFNLLGQYATASSPGNRAYCYAELAVSSLEVVEIRELDANDAFVGCSRQHDPSTRLVETRARQHGPLTRVVETGL